MAIQIYCTNCRSSCALDTKKCPKCTTVFKRDNRKYRVTVSVKGNRVNRIVDNLTLAREAETTIKTDILRGEFETHQNKNKPAPTLNEVWDKYQPWAEEHKKTWKIDLYNYSKHLQSRYGKKRLDSISPIDIERMKIDLKQGVNKHKKPYTKATIKHQLVLLKRLYNIAKKWNLYDGQNPVDQVQMPKLDNQKTEFFNDDELTRLLNVLESWPCRESAAFVKFALLTGFRRSELFKLKWEDVDLIRGSATLRDPKPGKTITVPVSEDALEVLKGLERSYDYVFPGKNGEQRTDFKGPWLKIRKEAGLPKDFRFHGLRHNFASQLVSNGEDLYTVGKLLGHRNTSTTQRYAHLADERLRQAAAKSGRLLNTKAEITVTEMSDELQDNKSWTT